MSDSEALASFLLGRAAPPPRETLRAAGIEAYAYAALPEGHPDRPAHRPAYLDALARHHAIRRELLPLLRAWTDAGIETLLFKGFHLAEFVYPVPGMRPHGDVDVLIHPAREGEALRIAGALGWRRGVSGSDYGVANDHTAYTLFSAAGANVDVHRAAVHAYAGWSRAPARITAAVWAGAREREWEGMTVREMQPVDAALVGLVLQRSWGDGWRLKAADPLDLRLLAERGGVTPERLRARAAELGCPRTLDLFLRRCDPWAGVLDLRPRTEGEKRKLDAAVAFERLPLRLETALYRLRIIPDLPGDLVRYLPLLLRVRRAMRETRDLSALLRSLTPPSPVVTGDASLRGRVRVVRGVVRLTRILRVNPKGDCLLRSLAIYAALRERGWPAVLVTGVRRDPSGVVGHAWVEVDGRVLEELKERQNRARYQVSFRYPPAPGAEPVTTGAEYSPAGAGAAPPG